MTNPGPIGRAVATDSEVNRHNQIISLWQIRMQSQYKSYSPI